MKGARTVPAHLGRNYALLASMLLLLDTNFFKYGNRKMVNFRLLFYFEMKEPFHATTYHCIYIISSWDICSYFDKLQWLPKFVETKVKNLGNSKNDSIFEIPYPPLPQISVLNLAKSRKFCKQHWFGGGEGGRRFICWEIDFLFCFNSFV